jgi:hypothetical protein
MRYINRHVRPSSLTRSSWQRAAIEGIGRDCGILSFSPCWRRRSRNPVSIRAALENGGVLTWPWSHERGLSWGSQITVYVNSDIQRNAGDGPSGRPDTRIFRPGVECSSNLVI